METTKKILMEVVQKYEKSLKREKNYLKELDNDKATLAFITERIEAKDDLPDGCVYESYDEWVDTIKKEIESSNKSLGRLKVKNEELKAIRYYLNHVSEESAA